MDVPVDRTETGAASTPEPVATMKPISPQPLFDAKDVIPFGLLAVTIGGMFGAWHWGLDLMSHFRWQYGLLAIGFLVLRIRSGRRWAICALIVTVVWNGVLIAPYYLPLSIHSWRSGVVASTSHEAGTSLSIVSLNVLTSNPNKTAVIEYLRKSKADVIGLMEVDSDWYVAIEELADEYPHRLVQPRPDNFGIALLSKWPFDSRRIFDAGADVPSITANLTRNHTSFTIILTHPLPPAGGEYTRRRDRQLRNISDLALKGRLPQIVMGDLNATPWSHSFRDIIGRTGLRDTALGWGIQSSWNARNILIRIPIDHILVSKSIQVERRAIGPDVGSDHFPVEAILHIYPTGDGTAE